MEVTLRFRTLQHDVVAGIQPLGGVPLIDNPTRLACPSIASEHTRRLPYLALPPALDGAALHDDRYARSRCPRRYIDGRRREIRQPAPRQFAGPGDVEATRSSTRSAMAGRGLDVAGVQPSAPEG